MYACVLVSAGGLRGRVLQRDAGRATDHHPLHGLPSLVLITSLLTTSLVVILIVVVIIILVIFLVFIFYFIG